VGVHLAIFTRINAEVIGHDNMAISIGRKGIIEEEV
jgi:hypothetical protein